MISTFFTIIEENHKLTSAFRLLYMPFVYDSAVVRFILGAGPVPWSRRSRMGQDRMSHKTKAQGTPSLFVMPIAGG